jgi:hypothetical protein
VVDHEGELLRKQADVECVEHSTHRRNGEIALKVFLMIPAERANPLVGVYSERPQRVRKTASVCDHIGIRCRACGEISRGCVETFDRGDLGVGEDLFSTSQDVANQEGRVLHCALHGLRISEEGAMWRPL